MQKLRSRRSFLAWLTSDLKPAPHPMNSELVLRSHPRLVAPGVARGIRRVPAGLWLLVIVIVAIALAYTSKSAGVGAAVLVLAGLLAAPTVAKSVNASVFIDADYVVSRDALRRTTRCLRSELVGWRVVPSETLGPRVRRVQLLDRDGKVRLGLAFDSYSDEQFDQMRTVLGLAPLI